MLQEPWAQPDKGEFPLVSLTPLLREKNGRETSLLWLLFSSLLKDLLFCAAVGKPALCLVCPGFAAEVTHMFLTTAHMFLLSGLWVEEGPALPTVQLNLLGELLDSYPGERIQDGGPLWEGQRDPNNQ